MYFLTGRLDTMLHPAKNKMSAVIFPSRFVICCFALECSLSKCVGKKTISYLITMSAQPPLLPQSEHPQPKSVNSAVWRGVKA